MTCHPCLIAANHCQLSHLQSLVCTAGPTTAYATWFEGKTLQGVDNSNIKGIVFLNKAHFNASLKPVDSKHCHFSLTKGVLFIYVPDNLIAPHILVFCCAFLNSCLGDKCVCTIISRAQGLPRQPSDCGAHVALVCVCHLGSCALSFTSH